MSIQAKGEHIYIILYIIYICLISLTLPCLSVCVQGHSEPYPDLHPGRHPPPLHRPGHLFQSAKPLISSDGSCVCVCVCVINSNKKHAGVIRTNCSYESFLVGSDRSSPLSTLSCGAQPRPL